MKKVLQVVSCMELGGTEAFIMNQYRNIDRTQLQFDFFIFRKKDYPYLEEIHRLGGNVIWGIPPKSSDLIRFLKAIVPLLKNGGYCAVHSHVNLTNAWVMLAARIAGIPIRISHSHDTTGREGSGFKRLYREMEARILRSCSTVFLACSKEAGDYLYGESLFRTKGRIIHNGIRLEPFLYGNDSSIRNLREQFAIPADCDLVVGNISRFEAKKNPLFTVEVFREIVKQRPQAILLLGGQDAGLLNETRRMVAEYGLTDRVRFIGVRRDMPDCLHLIDVFLFPSLFEGLPIALLEAQAAGCLCAVSSTVSEETDMGIHSLLFVDLSIPASEWAERILERQSLSRSTPPEEIRDAFRARGFDVAQSAEELKLLYQGE